MAIAFDRYEGYFGPAYETGALAPVVGRLESNTSVFNPKIRQLYATGDAATLVTQEAPTSPSEKTLKRSDESHVAYFGTGSVVGLKVAFDPNGTPQSLALGYKRKEFSFIPVIKGADDTDKYGSTLASFGINVETLNLPGTTFGVDQFFATGAAAENLAVNVKSIRDYFVIQAKNAMRPKPMPFYYDKCSATLENRLNKDIKNNAQVLKDWISRNRIPDCSDGDALLYGEPKSCRDLCLKAAGDLKISDDEAEE